jgi:integrase
MGFLEAAAAQIKTKNNFSAAKNGLKQFKQAFPDLALPTEEYFKCHSIRKRNWTVKPKNTLYLDEISRKINSLRNVKYKYAFRLMLVSGLRVFEVAALTKNDIEISGDGQITVIVQKGKGGSGGIVKCLPDDYLAKRIPQYMVDKPDGKPLFYETKTMKEKAGKLGIECHDLRRIAAMKHRKAHIKDQGALEANKGVQMFLRHERFSTTKRYIFNKKLGFKRKRNEDT